MTKNPDIENKDNVQVECFNCGNTEDNFALLSCRKQGQSLWVCTRCLPALIHG